MRLKRILLDSNAYLRLANSFHPLLNEPFGKDKYALYLIPEFQKEFDRNPRLSNKFGWVNQPEYVENRKLRIRVTKTQKEQIILIHSYLWPHNINVQFQTDGSQRHQNIAKLPPIYKRLALPIFPKRRQKSFQRPINH